MTHPTKPKTLRGVGVLRTPWRNFAGGPTKVDPNNTKRFFNAFLDRKQYEELLAEGWRVKIREPREEGGDALYFMKVNVNFGGSRPPVLVTVSAGKKTAITEETVDALDGADIDYADIIVNPYVRDKGDPEALASAYLKTGHFYITLDELEQEFQMEEEDGQNETYCDDEGVCYINGVRIN